MSKLESITRNLSKPPRIALYGVPGIGKTTFASQAPNPIFIPIEDGLCDLDVPAFPQPESVEDLKECIGALVTEDHDYKTVIIDSATALEPIVYDAVCREGGKDAIGDFGYGKGYDRAADIWREVLAGLDALREKGLVVVILAHSQIVRFEAPDSDGYDRWNLRLHKKVSAMISDWADCVLFANEEVNLVSTTDEKRKRGVSSGKRIVHTTETAAWAAKNRYSMKPTLPLAWDSVAEAIRGE